MFRLPLVLTVALAAACAAPAAVAPPEPDGPMLVSTTQLAADLNDPDLVLLHVADRPSGFEEGHIPGARYIRYGDFAVNGNGLGAELPPADELARVLANAGVGAASRVVIYGGNPVVAARLFYTLDVAGHPRVALLDGGLRAWRNDGRDIASGAAKSAYEVKGAAFVPRYDTSKVAAAEAIRGRAAGKDFALLDVRPDDEFTGDDGGMGGAHAAGHIEGARQLPWNVLVDDNYRFLPTDQLRAKFQGAGAADGTPVIAYCMIGMRASVVYFVARHLGYDVRLYDGSIMDWSMKGLPVVRGR